MVQSIVPLPGLLEGTRKETQEFCLSDNYMKLVSVTGVLKCQHHQIEQKSLSRPAQLRHCQRFLQYKTEKNVKRYLIKEKKNVQQCLTSLQRLTNYRDSIHGYFVFLVKSNNIFRSRLTRESTKMIDKIQSETSYTAMKIKNYFQFTVRG